MALTEEQLNRIEELKAEKQAYIAQRSDYYTRKANIQAMIDNIEVAWENVYPTPLEPIENPRLYKVDLENKATELHGNSNFRDQLHFNIKETYNWCDNNYDSSTYSDSTLYDYWKTGFGAKVNNNDRRNACLEILEKCKQDYNDNRVNG